MSGGRAGGGPPRRDPGPGPPRRKPSGPTPAGPPNRSGSRGNPPKCVPTRNPISPPRQNTTSTNVANHAFALLADIAASVERGLEQRVPRDVLLPVVFQ